MRQCDHRLFSALGSVDEAKQGLRFFVFEQVVLDKAEDLGCVLGSAGGKEDAEHSRVVEAEIDLLSVGELHFEKMTKMFADFLKFARARQIDAPVLTPAFADQGFEEEAVLFEPY